MSGFNSFLMLITINFVGVFWFGFAKREEFGFGYPENVNWVGRQHAFNEITIEITIENRSLGKAY
ncbi:uncharacterized protein RCO7_14952 [Rhynchosporium graminicola]|uniref:Uncharacterized protein n=1 Tax=Rhynchosporium graminicola TaxID=2792576 RepID=A0A1E1LE75_9HELO|nr:uncharacterized protein RCO7_14952 [Rhynchosporium commune]